VTAPDYPVEALSPWLRDWVEGMALELQVDAAMLAPLALTGVSLLAALGDVEGDWCEPLLLWTLVVAPSGERKSAVFAVLRSALDPAIGELRRADSARVARESAEHKKVHHAVTAAEARLKKDPHDPASLAELEAAERQATELSERIPHPPAALRLITADATPEVLGRLLARHGRQALLTDEAAELFDQILGRYNRGRPNFDIYAKGYTGGPTEIDRVGRPSLAIPSTRLVIGAMTQPCVVRELAAQQRLRSRGLHSRFWFHWPDSLVGQRLARPPRCPDTVRQQFAEHLLRLPRTVGNRPFRLMVDPAARALLADYFEGIEANLGPHSVHADDADLFSRFPGLALRVAGLLQLCDRPDPERTPIGRTTMERALKLTRHAEQSALQTVGDGAIPELAAARHLLAVLRQHYPTGVEIAARDLQSRHLQGKVSLFPNTAAVDAALNYLTELNYLKELPPSPTGRRGRPRAPRWLLSHKAMSTVST
jgi:replicative DNA helicase